MYYKHMPGHDIGYRQPAVVFGALMLLTAITISAALLDLGNMASMVITLVIAGAKAACVLIWFMHLKSEQKFFWYLGMLVLITLIMIIGFTFSDYGFRTGALS